MRGSFHRLNLTGAAILFVIFACEGRQIAAADPIRVGSQLQLFLDDRLIASQDAVRRVMHSPRPGEIVIQRDQPWEDSTMYDPVVIKDGDRYRMWYRANFNKPPFYTAYAESDDGIRWIKPALGLVEFQGSKENNIVWAIALSRFAKP